MLFSSTKIENKMQNVSKPPHGGLGADEDYYPFGMIEPGRQYAILGDSAYRFGFNGKLHDDDIYGKENSYDYGMRFYDPRLGRFLSVDNLAKQYPELSPYQYASDRPIDGIDLDGKEHSTARGAEELPNGGYTSAVDATAIAAYSIEERQAMEAAEAVARNNEQQRPMEVISQGGVLASSEYKQFSYNIELEAKLLLPVEQFKKIANGEKLSATDWAILGISFIPAEKIFTSALKATKGIGGELLAQYSEKFSRQFSHLTESDIEGALKDIAGNPIVNETTGKTYKHLQEVEDALSGVGKKLGELTADINKGEFKGDALEQANSLRKTLTDQKNKLTGLLNKAKNDATASK